MVKGRSSPSTTSFRKRRKWLIYPALLGGAALLADGTLTPAVTVTTAIEGLKGVALGPATPINSQTTVIWVTFTILLILFLNSSVFGTVSDRQGLRAPDADLVLLFGGLWDRQLD